jgi:energy-coupling factor transport system substrate-specific component
MALEHGSETRSRLFTTLLFNQKELFLSQDKFRNRDLYFTTRDLLIMTVLAAMGGVASTFINTLGDAIQATLGFAGGTQWAAGLHVIWIVLAVGILRKPGTGIFIGILKGLVELLSGNTHGVIILLVNLVAGLLVDFWFLVFRKKMNILPYLVAGGIATGSNVLVFQIFATLPENILGYSAVAILFLVALVSGVIFAGIIPYGLVTALSKGGIVFMPNQPIEKRRMSWFIVFGAAILAIIFAMFLRGMLTGPQEIQITGAVNRPFNFPSNDLDVDQVNKIMDYRGVMTEYRGYPLLYIIQYAQPVSLADTILLQASDGYAFLISFEELKTNPNILLVQNGKGVNASFDIVGTVSSKAWVRNLEKITVATSAGLMITDSNGEIYSFDPDQWLAEMDSTSIDLPQGSQKLQGVPLWKIINYYQKDRAINQIIVKTGDGSETLPWSDIENEDNLRLFTVIEEQGITFVLGEMSGKVIISPVSGIEIK